MARQAPISMSPESGTIPLSSSTPRIIGMYGSYYKLFRCSDGKHRMNLISEEEYLDSKTRPISCSEITSSTSDVCSHPALTSFPHLPFISPSSHAMPATVDMVAPLPARRQRNLNFKHRAAHPQHPALKRRLKEPVVEDTAVPIEENESLASLSGSTKRQKRDRIVRSTVAVADLIAEYIPPTVPLSCKIPIQEQVPSSTSPRIIRRGAINATTSVIPMATPIIRSKDTEWIQSVGRRFPMADMSVRQVLDVLDRRPENTTEDS